MADNIIKVTVSSSTKKNVTVSSANVGTEITASSDTGKFWAQTSKNWAVSDSIVDNTDYSSKYYANKAKESANIAQSNAGVCGDIYNSVQEVSQTVFDNIDIKSQEAVTNINNAKTEAVDSINSTKSTAISDIEFVVDGEKQEIQGLVDDEKEEIKDLIGTGKDELKEAIGDVKILTTLEIGDIGIAPLGIDETKGKRRYLNGQVIIQEQYIQFTNKVKSAVALYPSLACTESEWQTTATMTVGGQVGKFVIDDEAGTIRLPKIIMPIQGLTDLSKLGEIVEAGLPNIEGEYTGNACREYGKGTGAFTEKDKSNYSYSGFTASGSGKLNTLIFDASLSNPIYKDGSTVQQEQIQYPYFIQVATGAETKEDFENEHLLNIPFFIGYSQYFENAPYNLSWSVGGSTLTRAVHPAYYDALLIELNADIEVGTTQNNYTKRGLPVKLATDSDITDYDFVVNPAEETFTLPLLNGSESLPGDKYISLGSLSSDSTYTPEANGFIKISGTGTAGKYVAVFINGSVTYGSKFIAATNQPIFGTVPVKRGITYKIQYTATLTGIEFTYAQGNGSLYFYVGETVQNANLINAGRIEETLVKKVDMQQATVASFPSSRYVDLTLGASGTDYTAPANGWFCINKASTAGTQRVTLLNENSSIQVTQNSSVANQTLACYVPIKKGETCKVVYDTGGTLAFFRFVYAEGDR